MWTKYKGELKALKMLLLKMDQSLFYYIISRGFQKYHELASNRKYCVCFTRVYQENWTVRNGHFFVRLKRKEQCNNVHSLLKNDKILRAAMN